MPNQLRAGLALALATIWATIQVFEWLHLPMPAVLDHVSRFVGPLALAANLDVYWRTGTLRTSPLSLWFSLSSAMLLVAYVVRIMHWPYAREIFVLSFLCMIAVYGVHFARKPEKRLGDILRLLVVVIGGSFFTLYLMRLLPAYQAWLAVMGICMITPLELLLATCAATLQEKLEDDPENSENLADDHPELFQ